jgi:mono/diheme cytochrome c family protein
MQLRLLLAGFLCLSSAAAAEELEQQAYQILEKNCFVCHGAAMQMSKLDLRTRETILRGGERGPALEPLNPRRSRLYTFAAHLENPTMPPGQKLADGDIDLLRRWIMAGAIVPETAANDEDRARQQALAKLEERPVTDEERQFWSFQPPVRHDPPAVEASPSAPAAGKIHPIDAFLAARWREKGLHPSPPAGRRTLIRRAYLDLIGLPPEPAEVAAFVNDSSPDAFEKLIDRLLASPHYGERWGRHWLDLVRYADSGGFERDFDWPNAWRYRDYVVAAFNSDKPYDQFIREQIAGDEIAPDSNEAHVATGYLRLGPDNNIKTERTRMDELDDILATTGLTFLGMTVQCARCHNHKFDPIPQKDYYRMQAVFFSTKAVDYPLVDKDVVARYNAEQKRIDKLQEPIKKAKSELEKPYHDRLFEQRISELPEYVQVAWRTPPDQRTEGQRLNARQIEETLKIDEEEILAIMPDAEKQKHRELVRQIAALNQQRPQKYPSAMTIGEEGRDPLPSFFLHRGSPGSKGSRMPPGVLTVASWQDVKFFEPPPDAASSGRRRVFAEWIASERNPLTARVLVNRLWQHHFGNGIVRTPSNFGKTGERPTHPELLDWLAVEFVENGWSLKKLHRLMMTSQAYQMVSDDLAANLKADPENRLFWRMPRERLEAEIVRDQMLAVAGTLDRTTGGPAVFPYIDPALFQSSTGRTWPGRPESDPSTQRRSLYVFSKRSIRYPMFEAFDQPDMINSCDRRNRSTISPQALLLMNNAFVMRQAKFFAQRVMSEAGADTADQVERAYQLALARPPREHEKSQAVAFIQGSPYGLVDFCQTLFNLNEFVYRQ